MKITAIVCTYQRPDSLAETLRALLAQSLPPEACEILVVDNSPVPNVTGQLAANYANQPHVRFLHQPEPGLSHARNLGVREARTPLVAFIDDDAVAAPDWLEQIVFAFAGDERLAAVGGLVTPLWEAPRPPWLHDNLLGYLSVLDWGDQPLEVDDCRWLIGTNVAYRRDALLAAGGFRSDLGRRGNLLISNEELELSDRLRVGGGRVWYFPTIRVAHRVPAERLTREWFRQRIFWQAVSDAIAGRAPSAAQQRSAAGWWSAETNDPRTFAKECERIAATVHRLSNGGRM